MYAADNRGQQYLTSMPGTHMTLCTDLRRCYMHVAHRDFQRQWSWQAGRVRGGGTLTYRSRAAASGTAAASVAAVSRPCSQLTATGLPSLPLLPPFAACCVAAAPLVMVTTSRAAVGAACAAADSSARNAPCSSRWCNDLGGHWHEHMT